MILGFAGNRVDGPGHGEPRFPSDAVDRVGHCVGEFLSRHQPDLIVGAAAAGADLIVLEQATRLSIATQIVLPLKVHEFRRRSVEDRGYLWCSRFDEVIERSEGIVIDDLSGHKDWYLRGNDLILDTATGSAEGKPLGALVLTSTQDSKSASADFHRKAKARLWEVFTIDPMGGFSGSSAT